MLTEQGVNRVPVSDQLAFDVEVQNQGESEETDVGRLGHDHGRQDDQGRPDDPADRGRARPRRSASRSPRQPDTERGQQRDGRGRAGPGREEQGQQHGHLPGRVHRRLRLGRPVRRREPPRLCLPPCPMTSPRPSASSRSRPAASRCSRSLLVLVLLAAAAAAAQRPDARCSATSGERDLVTHAERLADRSFDELRALVRAAPSTQLDAAARRRTSSGSTGRSASTAVVRYDAYNEMSGRQSSSMALLDDDGHRRRAVLDPPPRPGAHVREGRARRPSRSSSSRPRRTRRSAPPSAERSRRRAAAADAGAGRLPRARGHLQRGGAASPPATARGIEPVPLPTIYDCVMAVAGRHAPTARSCRSRTRSRARSTRRSTRSCSRPTRCRSSARWSIRSSTLPDRARRSSRWSRSSACSRTRRPAPSAPGSCASELPQRRGGAGRQHRRRGADRGRERRALGRARHRASRPSSTAARSCSSGVEDHPENETRFVWLASERHEPDAIRRRRRPALWKTSIVFWGLPDAPGALVERPAGVRRAAAST